MQLAKLNKELKMGWEEKYQKNVNRSELFMKQKNNVWPTYFMTFHHD